MALSWVAITDSPTAHHGRLRPPRKYPSSSSLRFVRRMPSQTIHTRYTPMIAQSTWCIEINPSLARRFQGATGSEEMRSSPLARGQGDAPSGKVLLEQKEAAEHE